jgi:23S rRNA (pseudouridine1915-N3)-methyltransferase
VRVRVVCVGRADGGLFGAAASAYLARLHVLAPTELISVRPGRGQDLLARRRSEAQALRAQGMGRTVALDERGERWDTTGLAAHFGALELRGEGRMTFWIGGADGLDPELLGAADERWRLSDLTLPHELALVVLLEQLYRVASLRAGHPYHRA